MLFPKNPHKSVRTLPSSCLIEQVHGTFKDKTEPLTDKKVKKLDVVECLHCRVKKLCVDKNLLTNINQGTDTTNYKSKVNLLNTKANSCKT